MIRTLALAAALYVPGDGWFGVDKVKHFFLSAFVQSVSYSALRAVRVDHDRALIGASATTLAVGVGKELYDRHDYGHFSVRDLSWDMAGGASASVLLSQTRR